MYLLLEYFYCFLYVLSLTYCVYKYLDRKVKKVELVLFLLIYALLDLLITGNIVFDIRINIVQVILVVLSDFLMICLLNRKVSLFLGYYTLQFYIFYEIIVTSIVYLMNYLEGFSVLLTLQASYMRFMMVIVFNALSVIFFKTFEKMKVIPNKKTSQENSKTLLIISLMFMSVYFVFYWLNKTNESNTYLYFLFGSFVFLWLILLYVLNKSYILTQKREQDIVIHSINQNIQTYMNQYKKDEERINKIRHDMKNHFLIIKEINDFDKIKDYVNHIFPELENINAVSKYKTGNLYLDTILNSKIQEFPDVDIHQSIEINDLKMDIRDFSILIFNLLDNAFCAAQKVKGNVYVDIKYVHNYLLIYIKNSCNGKTDFLSDRGEGHGYGLNIVKEIVKKYNGNIEYASTDECVVIEIALTI